MKSKTKGRNSTKSAEKSTKKSTQNCRPKGKNTVKNAKKQTNKAAEKNPFVKAKDVYITKNKIAVVTVKNESTKRSHTQTIKTEYLAQSKNNLAKLKQVTSCVRLGKRGCQYASL
jgi:hypothetical protein